MSRALLVAELATAHHGDVGLAEAMIAAAAEAGADYVKTQAYSLDCLNPADPQAQWLRESHLDEAAHIRLKACAEQQGVTYLSTPFDWRALEMLLGVGLKTLKIAHSNATDTWWRGYCTPCIVSWPWGVVKQRPECQTLTLAVVPDYPASLQSVAALHWCDGYSDHCEGLSACYQAIALGAKMVEVHFTHGNARRLSFDKTSDDIRTLRAFAEDCWTMRSGVAQKYRERWSKSA